MIDTPSHTPLRKNWFLFVNSYVANSSLVKNGVLCLLLLVGSTSGLNLYRSATVCEFICVSALLYLEDWESPNTPVYDLSASSYSWTLEPWGEWFEEDITFRTECSKVAYKVCTLSSCESLC